MSDNMPGRPEDRFRGHPLHALFFTFAAFTAYALLTLIVFSIFVPDLQDRIARPRASDVQILWALQIIIQMAAFAHVSYWAEHIGAGPFAGRLRSSLGWLIVTLVSAPIIYKVIEKAVLRFVPSGQPETTTVSEITALMGSAEAIGPLMYVGLIVVAPLATEVIYRGVCMGYLLSLKLPSFVAIILTAGAFTLMNSQYTLAAVTSTFLLGVFLGWLRVRSGSMAPPIVAHMAINLYVVRKFVEASG